MDGERRIADYADEGREKRALARASTGLGGPLPSHRRAVGRGGLTAEQTGTGPVLTDDGDRACKGHSGWELGPTPLTPLPARKGGTVSGFARGLMRDI